MESLYIEIEKQPSASVNPVTNHGLSLDGLGSIRSVLYFFIPKAFKVKECLNILLRLGLTNNNPRIQTCFNLILPLMVLSTFRYKL